MASIWVFVREADGDPSSIGLELVTKARDLGDVTVVYVGTGSDGAFAKLGEFGASKVVHIDPGDNLAGAPVARVLSERVASDPPESDSLRPGL